MNYEKDLENVKKHFTTGREKYIYPTKGIENEWCSYINITKEGYVIRTKNKLTVTGRYYYNHIQMFIL